MASLSRGGIADIACVDIVVKGQCAHSVRLLEVSSHCTLSQICFSSSKVSSIIRFESVKRSAEFRYFDA